MALVLAENEAKPSTFDNLFDGFSVRCCYLDGKYYVSVRDLIIGMCVESPKKDAESWNAACKYASQTWQRTITPSQKEEFANSLKTFQFKGNCMKICVCEVNNQFHNLRKLVFSKFVM